MSLLLPGSRSAPMAYALAEASAAGKVELLVRIDERSAGFTALGLALATGAPVAVLTTSGTAVGNLLPAVMEANHAAVPLVVVSADRPEELRGTGANQTTVQLDLFGEHVRFAVDVPAGESPQRAVETSLAAATGAFEDTPPGPVQLNLAFRDPLVPEAGERLPEQRGHGAFRIGTDPLTMTLDPAPADLPERRTVVLAGHDAGPVAEAFARAHGLPLLAEPSSNSRFGPNAVGPYRLLLEHFGPESALPIERVVVFGRPTLSRPVSALLARTDIPAALYQPVPVAWYEQGRRRESPIASLAELAEFAGRGSSAWLDAWLLAGAAAQHAVDGILADRRGSNGSRRRLPRLAARPGPAGPRLVQRDPRRRPRRPARTQSRPPRFSPTGALPASTAPSPPPPASPSAATRKPPCCWATLPSCTTPAASSSAPARTSRGCASWCSTTPAAQSSASWNTARWPRQAATGTPSNAFSAPRTQWTLRALAAAYGVGHCSVSTTAGLAEALAAPFTGRTIIEVRTDRHGLRTLHGRIKAAVGAAVAGVLDG